MFQIWAVLDSHISLSAIFVWISFFLSLDLQTAGLVLTHLFRVVSLPAAKKNQQLWAQTLKKPTDTQGLHIELLISLYLSSLLLCLITNYKWTRSISPNKWSEAHFEGGNIEQHTCGCCIVSWPQSSWNHMGWRTQKHGHERRMKGLITLIWPNLNVLIFVPFQRHIAWL